MRLTMQKKQMISNLIFNIALILAIGGSARFGGIINYGAITGIIMLGLVIIMVGMQVVVRLHMLPAPNVLWLDKPLSMLEVYLRAKGIIKD